MYVDFNTIITTIVTTICTALVAWLIAQLTSYLKAKSEKEKAEKKLKMIDHYTKIANDTITQLVDYLNNTVVNELKTASERMDSLLKRKPPKSRLSVRVNSMAS